LMLAIRWVDRNSKSTCAAACVHTLHCLYAMCLHNAGLVPHCLCNHLYAPGTASHASDPHPCMVSNLHLHCTSLGPNCCLRWVLVPQAYPHKILTGRRSRMPTIRQTGGMSGFTNRSESEYDPFGAGHSSTSISAALGMAVARDFKVCKQCRVSGCSAHLLFVQQAWQSACWMVRSKHVVYQQQKHEHM